MAVGAYAEDHRLTGAAGSARPTPAAACRALFQDQSFDRRHPTAAIAFQESRRIIQHFREMRCQPLAHAHPLTRRHMPRHARESNIIQVFHSSLTISR